MTKGIERMISVRGSGVVSAFAIIVLWSGAALSQSLSDEFNSLTIDSNRVTSSNLLYCSGAADPENLTMTVPPGSGNWAMVVSTAYPYTWAGTGATQSWAISGDVMYTHAEVTPYDDGLAWISRVSFDRSKYLSAKGTLSMDTCLDWVAGCMAGLTLITSEADYREIGLRSTGVSGTAKLSRLAPCDERDLLDASGNTVTVSANQLHNLRIDYLGPEGGGWRYWLNGTQLYLNTGTLLSTEPSTFLGAPLAQNPHLGIFYTGSNGKYVEGRVDRVNVYELTKVTISAVTASNSYPGSPASQVIDGNVVTSWAAGEFPTQWIEFDLGGSRKVRKVRLLTNQWPNGSTTHTIYVGASPNPTTAVTTLAGNTVDNQWLDVDLLDQGVTGRYVRVATTASPSWVAWREIEVYE